MTSNMQLSGGLSGAGQDRFEIGDPETFSLFCRLYGCGREQAKEKKNKDNFTC